MFQVLNPIASLWTKLTATSLADADGGLSAIANTTLYAVGARVFDATVTPHAIYQCVAGYTSGSPAQAPSLDATHWQFVSYTNPNKPFDTSNTTQASSTSPLSWTFTPAQVVSWVYLDGLAGLASVQVIVTDPVAGVVYNKVVALPLAPVMPDWYSYFYGVTVAPTSALLDDLPPYANATVQIIASPNAASTGYVGTILLGQGVFFGTNTRLGTPIRFQDYSYINTNTYGDVTLVPRLYSRNVDFACFLKKGESDSVYRFLASLRAVPTVFRGYDGVDGYQLLTIFGFFKNFEILAQFENQADCNVSVQGIATS